MRETGCVCAHGPSRLGRVQSEPHGAGVGLNQFTEDSGLHLKHLEVFGKLSTITQYLILLNISGMN